MTSEAQNLLHQLGRDFWSWRARHQPVTSDDLARLERPDDWEPLWSPQSVAAQRNALAAYEERWKDTTTVGWPRSALVDYELIGSALARVCWELDVTRNWQRNPKFYIDQTLVALFEELLLQKPFDASRGEKIIRLLASVSGTLADGRKNLAGMAVKPFAVAALAASANIRERLTHVTSELRKLLPGEFSHSLEEATHEAIAAFESFSVWLEGELPAMDQSSAVGREGYEFFLRHVALMPYTPEQLLAMGAQEWERALTFEVIARERAKSLPKLPLFSDEAAQMAREENDERETRRFLVEHDLLSVPAWMQHYRNAPMPAYLLPLADLGVADDLTSPSRLSQNGVSYIYPPSERLGYFALASARDPRPIIVHEGVPGHYFQLALSWAHENHLRRHYYDSGPNEGIGFYAEEMMLQAGFFDDDARTRAVIYNFMRLRALRVEVDVKLALGLFTIDEAAHYLQTRTPMDAETSRYEAGFFATIPGQAITYQIGKLQIIKFLADARRVQGEAFNLRAFHDYVWLNGNVPLALQRWEYLGLDDEIKALQSARSEQAVRGNI